MNSEPLRPGDRVLFFTDGVVEQPSPRGNQLGFTGLAQQLEASAVAGADTAETVRRWSHAVLEPEGGLRDDATLLLVEWKGPFVDHPLRPPTA